ncbi:DNHD1 [Bugula neritina]|uniref:DNHD1 n=1 Tax=Bugula neritina TaxID=10212 RepID=A0A7J7KD20_BUGNE|nr:DNHD1 [Bugula neritina]
MLQQQLTTIRNWSEKIKNFEKSFLSTNQLVLVDCTYLHNTLIPRLNEIYKDIIEFVAEQSAHIAEEFVRDMKQVVSSMKEKKSDIAQFAVYAKQVFKYKKCTADYQQQVEYIKSLFEVVRLSYRQLTVEEERLEGQVMQQWELFLSQMQIASEFINTHTPIMMKSLEESHANLIAEAERLGEAATSGKFLDPSQDATAILTDLRSLRSQFYSVCKKLNQASKWREAISGEGYQLDFLQEIGSSMDVRQELWKYVEVSTQAIKDWKSQLFKRMQAQKALDKITEWLSIATQMQSYLPSGDKVLAYWFSSLENFKKDLPLLHKMASDALKPTHWKAIFVGIGENYEEGWEFTVEEILGYNLAAHQSLIDAIFSRAQAEYRLEQKLNKIERLWTSNDVYFKLAKHIPDSVYTADKSRMEMRRGGEKNRASSRQTPVAPPPPKALKGLDTSFEDLYILIETDELQYLLEDSQVSLKQILSSPYISGFASATQRLDNKIREVEELLKLWINCQSKEGILKEFSFCTEKLRIAFPRLYFVTDDDVIRMMSVIRSPQHFIPIAKKCFPSIETMRFELPSDFQNSANIALDYQLNGDKLETVHVFGEHGESITLLEKVKAFHDGPTWLNHLEKQLKLTMVSQLQNCLLECLNNDDFDYISVLEEILEKVKLRQTELGDREGSMTHHSVSLPIHLTIQTTQWKHRLLKFPLQCLVAAEKILWSHNVCTALKSAKQIKPKLTAMRENLQQKLDEVCHVIRENSHLLYTRADSSRMRLSVVLKELAQCYMHLITTTNVYVLLLYVWCDVIGLLSAEVSCTNCFDWSNLLRYSVDISPLIRAKTFVHITEEKIDQSYQREKSLRLSSDPSRLRTPLTPLSKRNLSYASGGEELLEKQKTSVELVSTYTFGPLYVKQLDASYRYDHEYLGTKSTLISTPLTERAKHSLMMSLKDYQVGALIGPKGTGKTRPFSPFHRFTMFMFLMTQPCIADAYTPCNMLCVLSLIILLSKCLFYFCDISLWFSCCDFLTVHE